MLKRQRGGGEDKLLAIGRIELSQQVANRGTGRGNGRRLALGSEEGDLGEDGGSQEGKWLNGLNR